jgi:hypothetical protein
MQMCKGFTKKIEHHHKSSNGAACEANDGDSATTIQSHHSEVNMSRKSAMKKQKIQQQAVVETTIVSINVIAEVWREPKHSDSGGGLWVARVAGYLGTGSTRVDALESAADAASVKWFYSATGTQS